MQVRSFCDSDAVDLRPLHPSSSAPPALCPLFALRRRTSRPPPPEAFVGLFAGEDTHQIRNMPRQKRIRRGGTNSDKIPHASVGALPEFVKFNSDQAEDLTKDALNDFGAVFETCKSVVALSCTYAGHLLLACSGTVVDHVGSETWIITSASLVRKPGTEHGVYKSDDIKIKVVLHNKQDVEGSLAMCDLHYNLAIVTIKSAIHLPAVKLSDLPECYYMQPKAVVAVGRDTESVVLMRCGKLIRENSELDCSELLVTTCDVNEKFIGGPIIDSENRILGITFFYKETTPFLPVEIAARCLKSFKNRTLLPRLCIRGQAVHMLDIPVLEKLCCKYIKVPSGILVNKVFGISPENCGGIEVGDVISKLDGGNIYSVAQFTTMFIDKMEAAKGTQNTVTLQADVERPTYTFVANLNVHEVLSDKHEESFQNRWRLQPRKRRFMFD